MILRTRLDHPGDSHRTNGTPRRDGGQILVLTVLSMVAIIAMAALVLEGGNAYAQQRSVQNAADAAANAGAVVLAQSLAGLPETDTAVATAISNVSGPTANNLDSTAGTYYTNGKGQPLDASGNVVAANAAAIVGGGTIPPGARGVHAAGTRSFPTYLGRAIGFNSFTASADATAITGPVVGGQFLPVVFPIAISDCSGSGNTQPLDSGNWVLSPNPPTEGTEYIVPLCKTGGGSFQVLDWDNSPNDCATDVSNPPPITLNLPEIVGTDVGNNCAKPMTDEVNKLTGKVVLVPLCAAGGCGTQGGTNGTYTITQVASFMVDYMSYSNNPNQISSLCQTHQNPVTGQKITTIVGNGSSSCIAGWFVKYFPPNSVVDQNSSGTPPNTSPIGVQLIK